MNNRSIRLDYIRAFACYLIFVWHFIYNFNGHTADPPIFPLSIFTEGHTGVGIFMTLSGYIFAKLINNKKINFYLFIYNRILRLIPLIIFVFIIIGIKNYYDGTFHFIKIIKHFFKGFYKSVWPNGGWSITAEIHFYLILPFLLTLFKKLKNKIFLIFLIPLIIRSFFWYFNGQAHTLYWNIFGHIDEFLLGIFSFYYRDYFKKKIFIIFIIFLLFLLFFYIFDYKGGFYKMPSYPSPSLVWIFMPTITGISYGIIISWYDNYLVAKVNNVSNFFSKIGVYSYSIYLLHFFVVDNIAKFIKSNVVNTDNIYIVLLLSVPSFLFMVPIGYLSYNFIESPFLKMKKKYII